MMINRNNYEAFFLDYHEGNLGDASKKEVLAFVASNPDLQGEFESFEIISLKDSPAAVYQGKALLKKNTVTEYNYKTWFVASLENDLDATQQKEVDDFIAANPGFKGELELLKLTRLQPDRQIRFENKSSLKKGGVVISMWVSMAAAACVVIGLLTFWFIRQNSAPELVQQNQPAEKAIHPAEKYQPSGNKTIAETPQPVPAKQHNTGNKQQKPVQQKPVQQPQQPPLAENHSADTAGRQIDLTAQAPVKEETPPSVFVVHESKAKNSVPNSTLVVLDEKDMEELGLQKSAQVNNPLLADAVNGVGKIFGVNAHYDQEHKPLESKYKETYALGPLAITRTVSR